MFLNDLLAACIKCFSVPLEPSQLPSDCSSQVIVQSYKKRSVLCHSYALSSIDKTTSIFKKIVEWQCYQLVKKAIRIV